MDFHDHIGVLAEYNNRTISIFDADSLRVVQQIPVGADVIDVSVTKDCRRAVASSFSSRTLFQIALGDKCAHLVGSAVADTFLEDVKVTPDGRYAVSTDGSGSIQAIVSYSLRENAIVSSLPTDAQAVTVSPLRRDLVLTAVVNADSVRRFTIDRFGQLTDTGQTFPVGGSPNNIIFSPDGLFAFVTLRTGGVSVLSTKIPEEILLLDTEVTAELVQSAVISSDGKHLFALSTSAVYIFSFDPIAGNLRLERSFNHGLFISTFYGVEQIALDATETRLFISANGQVAVFTTFGLPLGTVAGASGPGGLAICRCAAKPNPDKEPQCKCV